MLFHNSHDAFYRTPSGAVPAGSGMTFRFACDEAENVILRTWMGEERAYPMHFDGDHTWEVSITLPEDTGLFWYDFILYQADGHTRRYGAPEDDMDGEGHVCGYEVHSYRITLYDRKYETPAFMHGAVIYQIFPDRFFKAPIETSDSRTDRRLHEDWDEDFFPNRERENGSMDFWGGNLNGIAEKLPYLQSLGVQVIYLNPIFQSKSNHRYDTGDYTRIDPLLGSEADFTRLCEKARALGMHIMLDGVFSHTGDDSLYFNKYHHYDSVGAYDGEESPYYRWYTFEHFPDRYRSWWGFDNLPECRKDEPTYRAFMFDGEDAVVSRWVRRGASGWRLDVADELSMDFLRELRTCVKGADPEAVVLGEVWEDASHKVAYGETRCYCTGDTLDSVMNYPLREAILRFVTQEDDAYAFVRFLRHQEAVYPPQFRYSLMNLLGSHDRPRVLNMLAGKDGSGLSRRRQGALRLDHKEYELAVKRYRTCLDLICALPGCPTVYYGDEAGMTGPSDPFCRRPFPWGREDRELTAYAAARLSHHRDSPLLRTGLCDIEVVDSGTVRIRRYMQNGLDALGQPTDVTGQEVFLISR